MIRTPALALACTLAACAAPPPAVVDDPDACGTAALKGLVGQPLARLDRAAVTGPLRVFRSGDPLTTDYLPGRLNVETDGRGTIRRIACG